MTIAEHDGSFGNYFRVQESPEAPSPDTPNIKISVEKRPAREQIIAAAP
jgi:hypothetical protein